MNKSQGLRQALAMRAKLLIELGQSITVEQQELVRGRLAWNTIFGIDKGVTSAKILGSDRRLNVRGILAEYLVARALSLGEDGVRSEWDAYDLTTPSELKIEIKSSAYIQSWHQKTYSQIVFSIRPTRYWNAETGIQTKDLKRQAMFMFSLFLIIVTKILSIHSTCSNGNFMYFAREFWMRDSAESIQSR